MNPDVQSILSQVTLDEPFDEAADLVAVLSEKGKPWGFFAGRTSYGGVALLEHLVILPEARKKGRILALAEAWAAVCRAKGLRWAVFGMPVTRKRPDLIRYARFWGFMPYGSDEKNVWWKKDLNLKKE